MTQLINVTPEDFASKDKSLFFCRELEKGNILFFLKSPFSLPEVDFFRSFKPKSKSLVAFDPSSSKSAEPDRMQTALEGYSMRVAEFLSQLLPSYAVRWKRDWAIFRSFQKSGPDMGRLQVDAFAERPMHGWRVLRFFTNIHPTEGKKWITSKSFAELAQEFAGKALPFPKSCTYSFGQRLERKIKGFLAGAGLKGALRSPYDHFMLRMQRFLKQNEEFQTSPKESWEFPPGSCWAFFTDQISHAALSGLQALEQIFLIPNQALLYPDQSPVSILERLSGRNLVERS